MSSKPGARGSSAVGKPKPKATPAEDKLYQDLQRAGLGEGLVREYLFHHQRKWRADLAYPSRYLLIEVEGGTWVSGRHNRGVGYAEDCRKYNAAQIKRYRVLRFTTEMVLNNEAIEVIRQALGAI